MASESMPLSMLQFIPSRKGEKGLVAYGGFLYEKIPVSDEDESANSYFCNRRKLGCKGKLIVDWSRISFRVSKKGHSHDPGNGSRCLTRSIMAKILIQNLRKGEKKPDGDRKIRIPKRRASTPTKASFLHSTPPPSAQSPPRSDLDISLSNTEVRGRTYHVMDQLLHRMTLPSSYISLITVLGTVLLAYLLQPIISTCNVDLQFPEHYHITSTTFNSSANHKLAHLHLQTHETLQSQMDFADLLEREVNIKCNQYRKEWETSIGKLKGEEYLQRNLVREAELSGLRQHFREKLKKKQQSLDNLARAVKTFKEDHISVTKSCIFLFLDVIFNSCLIGVGGLIGCVIYRYFYFI